MGTSKTRTLRAEEQQQKRDEKGDKNDDGRCTRTKASVYCARRRAARKKMARGTGHSPIRVSASRPIDRASRVGERGGMLGKSGRNAFTNAERFGRCARRDEDEERERGENAAHVRRRTVYAKRWRKCDETETRGEVLVSSVEGRDDESPPG